MANLRGLGRKLAVAMQQQQLIPGAPPVNRIVPPGQAPQPQPPQGAAAGIPQMPSAQIPQAPTATTMAQAQPPAPTGPKAPMTAQQVQAPKAAQPQAITNSEAIIGEKLNKMAARAYLNNVSKNLKRRMKRSC